MRRTPEKAPGALAGAAQGGNVDTDGTDNRDRESAAQEGDRGSAMAFGDRLRQLSRDVLRIGAGWRDDPERIAIQKDTIASELSSLARAIEGSRRHG